MRRLFAIVFAGVLLGALWSSAAFAGILHLTALPAPPDFTVSYAMRLFGRAPGGGSYLTQMPPLQHPELAYSRVFSLHDVTNRYSTFAVHPALQSLTTAPSLMGMASEKYTGPVLIASTAIGADKPAELTPSPAATASRAPVQTTSTIPAFSGSSLADDDTPSAFDSRMQDSATAVSMPIRVGAFTVRNMTSATQFSEAPSSDVRVHNYTWTAATDFDVQATRRAVNVNLNTDYEHVNTGSVASFTYDVNAPGPAAVSDLQAVNPALFAASGTAPVDITTHGIGGGLNVPLNHRLTIGLQYGEQRMTGAYGFANTPNLDTSKYSYLGNLTFALRPNTAITLSARQFRYQDNLLPANSYSQTRADLNFTVKL